MGDDEDRNSKGNVQGGTSTTSTPANNVDTGSNNSGSSSNNANANANASGSGSSQVPGHTAITNPRDSIGGFLGLTEQKSAAHSRAQQRFAESGDFIDKDIQESGLKENCQTEDHSFMGTKPGGAGRLPGSSVLDSVMDRFTK